MDDLIYREPAIDALEGKIKLKDSDDVDNVAHYIQQVARKINDLPSIDAQEIVRCKNCKYNPDNPRPFYDDDPVETYAWCKTEHFGDQGFCSCGKPAITIQPQEGEEE